jgi:phospholipase/carboxylesterase
MGFLLCPKECMKGNMVRSTWLWALVAAAAVSSPAGAAAEPARRPVAQMVRFEGASLYLPSDAAKGAQVPLLVLFPGTGGRAEPLVKALRPAAEKAGFALLGFTPRGPNFDTVDRFFDDREAGRKLALVDWPEPRFGGDAERIAATLDALSAAAPIDRARTGLLGFSHGASFALSLGLAQPGRFRSVAALSPGILLLPATAKGGQALFLAHGRGDSVQPFRRTACSFVPKLTKLGYGVRFRSFDGGHEIDGEVLREALAHFLAAGEPDVQLQANDAREACR